MQYRLFSDAERHWGDKLADYGQNLDHQSYWLIDLKQLLTNLTASMRNFDEKHGVDGAVVFGRFHCRERWRALD